MDWHKLFIRPFFILIYDFVIEWTLKKFLQSDSIYLQEKSNKQ
jgi:hypothetical protein